MEDEEATTVDMSSQASAMLERLMLAQAQECCFERALAAGKSPPVCSKVARQVRFTDCTPCPLPVHSSRYVSVGGLTELRVAQFQRSNSLQNAEMRF